MGFLLTFSPQLTYLQFLGVNWGLLLKRLLDVLGLSLMLYGIYKTIKLSREIKK